MPNVKDFTDLGFDMEPHRETVTSFGKMSLAPIAAKPALRARDMAVVRFPGSRFAVRVTDDPARREAEEIQQGCLAFAVIHHAESAAEARQIRAEVERYFLRHFPGRVLAQTEEAHSEGQHVYDCESCHPG